MMKSWQISLGEPPELIRCAPDSPHRGQERYQVNFWALNYYHAGRGTLTLNGHTCSFRPGCISITPPDTVFTYDYEQPGKLTWFHFRPAAPDGYVQIPLITVLKGKVSVWRDRVVEAACCHAGNPVRARAHFWALLNDLADMADSAAAAKMHPLLVAAQRRIEANYRQPLNVAGLAQELQISQTHLNRLFKAETGRTAGGYHRYCRVSQARYLLASTTLPLKAIAQQTGLADLHHLNKLIRNEFGFPPTHFRKKNNPD